MLIKVGRILIEFDGKKEELIKEIAYRVANNGKGRKKIKTKVLPRKHKAILF